MMLPFCEECHDIVNYKETELKKKSPIKGKQISYMGKEAYCNECNSSLFVSEIRAYNLVQLDEAYKEAESLL